MTNTITKFQFQFQFPSENLFKKNLHHIHYSGNLNLPSEMFGRNNEERLGGSRRVGGLAANC